MEKSQLKEKIMKLELEIEYLGKKYYLDIENQRLLRGRELAEMEAEREIEHVRNTSSLRQQLAAKEAQITELQKRSDSSAYKQLSDILKALVVKLPTLDIKEIHAHSGNK